MGIEIRQARPTDGPAACALLRRSIAEVCAADHQGKPDVLEAWLGNKTEANVTTWFSAPTNYALVAERDGQMVGMALLTQAGKIALCYVLPEALHGGVGRALINALECQARAWHINKLHLHSPPSSSAFYERQGFTNAGKEKVCFGLECDLLWKPLAADGTSAAKRFCNCSGK
jgi:GNAT superfamily N-acetyltransferase